MDLMVELVVADHSAVPIWAADLMRPSAAARSHAHAHAYARHNYANAWGAPVATARSSHCDGIRRMDRDESQGRIRQRLERPNCLEFGCSQSAWLERQLMKNRQQQQLKQPQKLCSSFSP